MKRFAVRVLLVLLAASGGAGGAATDGGYVVSTFVGGIPPRTPVAAREASIGHIAGMAVDAAGVVYLSSSLHCVFKIDRKGVLSRVAGTCRAGYSGDGGPAVDAQLKQPKGLAVDRFGALYIADIGNNVVRKVSAKGVITTVAGNGQQASSNEVGPATKVPLNGPIAVTIDEVGNLYIAEFFGGIRRVLPTGIISSLAGNGNYAMGPDGRTRLPELGGSPSCIAVDATGALYFIIGHQVRRISPSGRMETIAGTDKEGYSGDGGPAASAQLRFPSHLAFDRRGNLYIADTWNHRIRKIALDGTISTVAGSGEQGPKGDGGPARKAAISPFFLAIDGRGVMHVASDGMGDVRPSRLRRVSRHSIISTVAPNERSNADESEAANTHRIETPGDIAIDRAGNVYLMENERRRIRKIDRNGRMTTVAGCGLCGAVGEGGPATAAQLDAGGSLAVDSAGNLYLSQPNYHTIRRVSVDGTITTVAGTGTPGFDGDGGPALKARLNRPGIVRLDSEGHLLVIDFDNRRIRKISTNGIITTVAGNGKQGPIRDGAAATETPLAEGVYGLVADAKGNIFFTTSNRLRRVSRDGTISTVATSDVVWMPSTLALGAEGELYAVTGTTVMRLSPEGQCDVIAGTHESAYSGDGGPASRARFTALSGIAVDGGGRIYVSDHSANAVRVLTPQGPRHARDASDLKVELRSATGSNTFQVGEQIPLEVAVSSSTPNKYLEPCQPFKDSLFGFPKCRFLNRWRFAIVSGRGWVDPAQDRPLRMRRSSGMPYDVPNRALSGEPAVFPYVLTKQFRFDAPGEYRVQVAMNIGLNDETTQFGVPYDPANPPHSVSVVRELTLHIVPARAEWKEEVIQKGVQAFLNSTRGGMSAAEARSYEQARQALCNLGTPEAARALAGVLSQDNQWEAELCLERNPSRAAAIEEIQRLIADPDARITPQLFRLLTMLVGRERFGVFRTDRALETELKERLLAALPGKRGQARISSLLTVLANPKSGGKGQPYELPFAPPVIALAAENFDRFPEQSQQWLMDEGWHRVRSPLMLPAARKMAVAGNGNAILRWLELDDKGATAFIRQEIVRPEPRFSSLYLRLPDEALPHEEAQIVANFRSAQDSRSMARAASLLHRYATKAMLPTLLALLDDRWTAWERPVRVPVLAYLLKVSPEEGERRVRMALAEAGPSNYLLQSLFTDLGVLQPGPVLERLALETIGRGPGIAAADAARYLQRHGRAEVKPFVREEWRKWNRMYVESGTQQRYKTGTAKQQDYALASLVQALKDAFVSAQAWVLSTKDLDDVKTIVGAEEAKELGCGFSCGESIAVPDSPRQYIIYGGTNTQRREDSMDYLNAVERLGFSVNQYKCGSMDELKGKLLQFPAVATFYLATDLATVHREAATGIAQFLRRSGYQVQNAPE